MKKTFIAYVDLINLRGKTAVLQIRGFYIYGAIWLQIWLINRLAHVKN